jgi:hypothetical protein
VTRAAALSIQQRVINASGNKAAMSLICMSCLRQYKSLACAQQRQQQQQESGGEKKTNLQGYLNRRITVKDVVNLKVHFVERGVEGQNFGPAA